MLTANIRYSSEGDVTSPTAYRMPDAGSMTGVPMIPMWPGLNEQNEPVLGLPSAVAPVRAHTCEPSTALNAYTESPIVATYTRPL